MECPGVDVIFSEFQWWAPRCGHWATDRDHWAAGPMVSAGGGSGGNAQVLAPQEIFFENGKIGAILGGGPPPLFPLLFPFSPTFSLSSFPLSLTPGLHSTNAFKNLVLFALQCIKNHKILSTLQQSGRHLLQHPWRPHSNALHSADEAPLQTAQLLCCPSA